MTPDEQALLRLLFARLDATTEPPSDGALEAEIASHVAARRATPTRMVQVMLAQEAAINALRDRLSALEQEKAAEVAWQVGAARFLTISLRSLPVPGPEATGAEAAFLAGVFRLAGDFASGRLLLDEAADGPGRGDSFRWQAASRDTRLVPEAELLALRPPPEPSK